MAIIRGLEQTPPVPTEPRDDRPQQRREDTDKSLRTERCAADDREGVQAANTADQVVDVARARADAVLTDARDKADQTWDEDGLEVARERAEADDLLQGERMAADELLRREREDSARVLSSLLPLARRSTDRLLLTERATSDAALTSRDDFLGMVSHDLNNLLGAVMLSATALARRCAGTPEGTGVAKGTDRIQLYAGRMKRLVGDLVDVTSLAAGKLEVTRGANEANSLVSEAVETFRLLAAEKRISLTAEPGGQPLPVSCDLARTQQVLANLIGNAVKFTAPGGTVTVAVSPMGGEARFSVVDSGPGIPAALLEAVFERFWQAGGTDRRGMGLGLYIAKSIVEAHDGRIWVESRVGEGSSFYFTLPRTSQGDAARYDAH